MKKSIDDLIKAWKMCTKRRTIKDCVECPYRDIHECLDTMIKDSFEVYNNQHTAIEKLNVILEVVKQEYDDMFIANKNLMAEVERLNKKIKSMYDEMIRIALMTTETDEKSIEYIKDKVKI